MMLACPAGALLGWCVTGLLIANPINLIVRAAMERKTLSAATAEVLMPVILAVAATGGGAGFVIAGRKTGPQEKPVGLLAGYFLIVSLLLLLPEITLHPVANVSLWLGFVVGGLIAATRRQKGLSNQASLATSEPAPGAASSAREG